VLLIDFMEYSIESGNEGRVFAVSSITGALYVVGELSYQNRQVSTITRRLYAKSDVLM